MVLVDMRTDTMPSKLEHDITMKMLAGELTYEQGQRALRDPSAFKLSKRMEEGAESGENMRYKFWGVIVTPRQRVAYCWSLRRNEAGYFLGWRNVYDKNGRKIGQDQWTARKVKKRLKEIQLRRSLALLDSGCTTSARWEESIRYWAKRSGPETVDD